MRKSQKQAATNQSTVEVRQVHTCIAGQRDQYIEGHRSKMYSPDGWTDDRQTGRQTDRIYSEC